jgi:hypothetical protein
VAEEQSVDRRGTRCDPCNTDMRIVRADSRTACKKKSRDKTLGVADKNRNKKHGVQTPGVGDNKSKDAARGVAQQQGGQSRHPVWLRTRKCDSTDTECGWRTSR